MSFWFLRLDIQPETNTVHCDLPISAFDFRISVLFESTLEQQPAVPNHPLLYLAT